jgi:predicted ABC-type ATPase
VTSPFRIRMIAGPNGSGKSTIKRLLKPDWLGVYLNPDEIEEALGAQEGLSLESLGISMTHDEIYRTLAASELLQKHGCTPRQDQIDIRNHFLSFPGYSVQSYLASALTAIFRDRLIQSQMSFTFETVMSSLDKVEAMKEYGKVSARRYLYFIATEDPEINIRRVKQRVREGGHDVPEDKIRSRYIRSLENLLPCILETERAFLFDNSSADTPALLLAEVTNGKKIDLKVEVIPHWLDEHLLKKANRIP